MTAPDPGGNYTSMVSRGDTAALTPEQVNGSMTKRTEARQHAATRASVAGDGKVTVAGRQAGRVEKVGKAWRARTRGGKVLGLHATKQQAAGAVVLRHEGGA